MTLLHPFSFSFSELEGHGGKLGTCPSVVLCLARLYKGTKLEVRAGISLIRRCCGGVMSLNAVVFIGVGVENVQVDLSTTLDAVNIKVTEDVFCFVYDDEGGDKVPSRVTNPSERETFLTVFFRCSGL